MPRHRLGVVLTIRPPVGDAVDGLRRAFDDPARARVAPHVTLVPPVNVRHQDLATVLRILRRAAAGARPLEVALGPVRAFPGPEHVGYLAVTGSEAELDVLGRLRRHLRTGPLDRPDEHEFVPHVTITQGLDAARLDAVLAATTGATPWPVRLDWLDLLEEQHRPDGRRWVTIADVRLGPARVVGRGGLELELTAGHLVDPEVAAVLDERAPLPASPWPSPDGDGSSWLVVVARREGAVIGVLAGTVDGSEVRVSRSWVDGSLEHLDGDDVHHHLWAAVEDEAREQGLTVRGSQRRWPEA